MPSATLTLRLLCSLWQRKKHGADWLGLSCLGAPLPHGIPAPMLLYLGAHLLRGTRALGRDGTRAPVPWGVIAPGHLSHGSFSAFFLRLYAK